MSINFDGKGNIETTTDDGAIAVKLYSLEKALEEKDKEIERLNNIIKRLETDLYNMYISFGEFSEEYTENCIKKIKEGGDSENL